MVIQSAVRSLARRSTRPTPGAHNPWPTPCPAACWSALAQQTHRQTEASHDLHRPCLKHVLVIVIRSSQQCRLLGKQRVRRRAPAPAASTSDDAYVLRCAGSSPSLSPSPSPSRATPPSHPASRRRSPCSGVRRLQQHLETSCRHTPACYCRRRASRVCGCCGGGGRSAAGGIRGRGGCNCFPRLKLHVFTQRTQVILGVVVFVRAVARAAAHACAAKGGKRRASCCRVQRREWPPASSIQHPATQQPPPHT